jgi:hypothetical protein
MRARVQATEVAWNLTHPTLKPTVNTPEARTRY